MSELMSLIERERLKTNMSAETFAQKIGLTSTTYSRQKHGKQEIGLNAIQAYARFFRAAGNTDVERALMAYAFDREPDQIVILE